MIPIDSIAPEVEGLIAAFSLKAICIILFLQQSRIRSFIGPGLLLLFPIDKSHLAEKTGLFLYHLDVRW